MCGTFVTLIILVISNTIVSNLTNTSNNDFDLTDVTTSETQADKLERIINETLKQQTSNIENKSNDKVHVVQKPKVVDLTLVGKIAVSLIIIIGIPGNILSIIVINQKYFRRQSISLVLTCLAISDASLLLVFTFNKKFMMEFVGKNVRALSQQGCVFFFWVFRTSKMTSSWMIVLISVERFVAVWFPFKAHEINSR